MQSDFGCSYQLWIGFKSGGGVTVLRRDVYLVGNFGKISDTRGDVIACDIGGMCCDRELGMLEIIRAAAARFAKIGLVLVGGVLEW